MDRCPAANEFGVRNNPVCIDSVDTSGFVDITNGNPVDIATRVSVRKIVAYNPAWFIDITNGSVNVTANRVLVRRNQLHN